MGRQKLDITGQKFNKLTVVVCTNERDSRRNIIWSCLCDCGNTKEAIATDLKSGNIGSCGQCHKSNFKNLANQRFGKLLAIEQCEDINGRVAWLCKCDCGSDHKVTSNNLLKNNSTSCGCQQLASVDYSGEKFNKLLVINKQEKVGQSWKYNVKCDCGCEKIMGISEFTRYKSCGCSQYERKQ